MESHPTDTGLSPLGETRSLESSLKALWDRVRRAAAVIAQLRDDKRALMDRIAGLEAEVQDLRQELSKREAVRQLSGDQASQKGTGLFPNGEREVLAGRLRDILAKLDEYL